MARHNPLVTAPPKLTLSEVPRPSRNKPGADPRCRYCLGELPAGARRDARYCSSACRQSAYRQRAAGLGAVDKSVDAPAQNRESQYHRARRTPTPIVARVSAVPAVDDHDHSPRLCAVCSERRYLEIRRAPRARVTAELVAGAIRAAGGDVWPAVLAFGIEYRTALQIRAGFRGAGRRAEPIAYTARGWVNGRRPGWSADRLRLVHSVEHRDELGAVVRRHITGTAS